MEAPTPFGSLAGRLYEEARTPQAPPRRPSTTTVTIRLPLTQKALLRHLADYLGMKPATLAGSLLVAALESFVLDLLDQPKDPEDRRQLIDQLREGGVEVDEEFDTVSFVWLDSGSAGEPGTRGR